MSLKLFSNQYINSNLAIITFLLILISVSANADWSANTGGGVSMGEPQDIVVTLKSNPLKNPEAACLAVTFARMSKMGGANVTLFPTLDGVVLGDKNVVSGKRLRHFKCSITSNMDNVEPELSDGYISLEDNLMMFLDGEPIDNYDMLICTLCWIERYGDKPPDYGMLPPECEEQNPPSPFDCIAIMKMTLDADKVFDF